MTSFTLYLHSPSSSASCFLCSAISYLPKRLKPRIHAASPSSTSEGLKVISKFSTKYFLLSLSSAGLALNMFLLWRTAASVSLCCSLLMNLHKTEVWLLVLEILLHFLLQALLCTCSCWKYITNYYQADYKEMLST